MGATGLSADASEYRARLAEQSDAQIDTWAAEMMRDVAIRRGVVRVVEDFCAAAKLTEQEFERVFASGGGPPATVGHDAAGPPHGPGGRPVGPGARHPLPGRRRPRAADRVPGGQLRRARLRLTTAPRRIPPPDPAPAAPAVDAPRAAGARPGPPGRRRPPRPPVPVAARRRRRRPGRARRRRRVPGRPRARALDDLPPVRDRDGQRHRRRPVRRGRSGPASPSPTGSSRPAGAFRWPWWPRRSASCSPWSAGPGLVLLALVGLGIGLAYDLWAKGTTLSWLPFAVGDPAPAGLRLVRGDRGDPRPVPRRSSRPRRTPGRPWPSPTPSWTWSGTRRPATARSPWRSGRGGPRAWSWPSSSWSPCSRSPRRSCWGPRRAGSWRSWSPPSSRSAGPSWASRRRPARGPGCGSSPGRSRRWAPASWRWPGWAR